jgi:hypothetical protein
VAEIGDPSKMPLAVDLSLGADDMTLFRRQLHGWQDPGL